MATRWKKTWGLAVCVLVLSSGMAWAGNSNPAIQVIHEGNQSLVLELTVPPLQIQQALQNGTPYHLLTLPGFGLTREVGAPQVPVRGGLIAIPPEGDFEIEILAAPSEILPDIHLSPTPRSVADFDSGIIRKEFAIDPGAYTSTTFYPSAIVQKGFAGYMRHQRVAQVLFYPVQYLPASDTVRIYEKIRIRIHFETPFPAVSPAVSNNPIAGVQRENPALLQSYEQLLESSLLNYSESGRTE